MDRKSIICFRNEKDLRKLPLLFKFTVENASIHATPPTVAWFGHAKLSRCENYSTLKEAEAIR